MERGTKTPHLNRKKGGSFRPEKSGQPTEQRGGECPRDKGGVAKGGNTAFNFKLCSASRGQRKREEKSQGESFADRRAPRNLAVIKLGRIDHVLGIAEEE